MSGIARKGAGCWEEAAGQFWALGIKRVAQAEPGDVLHNVTGSELVAAMEDVLALLPRLHAPFVIGEWIRV